MADDKRAYFYNELIDYTDVYNDDNTNKKTLERLIGSVLDDSITKFFSELLLFIRKINNYEDFESIYDYVSNVFDKQLMMYVINDAANINKRSALFLEYYNARQYGFATHKIDETTYVVNIIRKYLSMGASAGDIESFERINNTLFNKRNKLIDAYLDTVIFSDTKKDSKLILNKNVK